LQKSASHARTKQEELKSEFMKCIEELSEAGEARAELEIHKEAANEYRSSNGDGREENEAESDYVILKQGLLFGILCCIGLYHTLDMARSQLLVTVLNWSRRISESTRICF
jgi:hypothetical protein